MYRFVPGQQRHPKFVGEAFYDILAPADAEDAELWLRGVELINEGYYWSAHEVLERLWHRGDKSSPQGQVIQGVIELGASALVRELGRSRAALLLWERGCTRLRRYGAGAQARQLGLDWERTAVSLNRPSSEGRPVIAVRAQGE